MFDLDQFIPDCRAALAIDHSHKLVHEVVARAVSDPDGVRREVRRSSCVEFLGKVLLEHLQPPDSFDNITTCFLRVLTRQ